MTILMSQLPSADLARNVVLTTSFAPNYPNEFAFYFLDKKNHDPSAR
jgi:hypothetical protein